MAETEHVIQNSIERLRLPFKLKLEQKDAIKEILSDRDVLCVLPTGYGKSVIYTLLPICMDFFWKIEPGQSIVVIISPLISLMEDQLASFSTFGVPAACISENQKSEDIKKNVRNGKYPIILLSPESLFRGHWRDILLQDVYQRRLCALVVDEAHCVVDWGKQFRTDFQRISELRALVPKVPILALTATATPQSRTTIKKLLNMKNVRDIVITADRTNITYLCSKTSYDAKFCFEWLMLKLKHDRIRSPKCIIYCRSISGAAVVYNTLMSALDKDAYIGPGSPSYRNSMIAMFHRATVPRNKKHVLETFVTTDSILRVVVATAAFGMGVNVPNVEYVIHWGAARTIDSFFQESGRAGRQGQHSTSMIYFHATDVSLKMTDATMAKYCKDVTTCRRTFLVDHFTPNHPAVVLPIKHFCCDVCQLGCDCGQCPPEVALVFTSPNPGPETVAATNSELVRQVSYIERDTAHAELGSFRVEYGLHAEQYDECFDSIINNMEHLFTVDDVMSNYLFSEEISASILGIIEKCFAY